MSTTSMAIFSNPLFATYSVYARNASIVVLLVLLNPSIPYHSYFNSVAANGIVVSSTRNVRLLLTGLG